jgi:hypothetical protein
MLDVNRDASARDMLELPLLDAVLRDGVELEPDVPMDEVYRDASARDIEEPLLVLEDVLRDAVELEPDVLMEDVCRDASARDMVEPLLLDDDVLRDELDGALREVVEVDAVLRDGVELEPDVPMDEVYRDASARDIEEPLLVLEDVLRDAVELEPEVLIDDVYREASARDIVISYIPLNYISVGFSTTFPVIAHPKPSRVPNIDKIRIQLRNAPQSIIYFKKRGGQPFRVSDP